MLYNNKTYIFYIALVLLFCQFSNTGLTQSFGGNPATLHFKQINTDSFRIIYPAGLDSTAQRIANVISLEQSVPLNSLGNQIRKINIVLQNQMTFSNGYVQLGPFRSEYYLNQPTNIFELGTQNWGENLAVHEFRHVEQYNNFDKGIVHIVRKVLGDNASSLLIDAAIPNWFFEGDAVYNETVMSKQGRGRLPLFMNAFKALAVENKDYDYQKLRNGSFQDYIPNHYNLGYLLVAYGYQKYGTEFWRKVTSTAIRYHGLFYPFQNAIKKYSGENFSDFKKNAFHFFATDWNKDKVSNLHIDYITKKQDRSVVNYLYPYPVNQSKNVSLKEHGFTDTIITLKTSYKHLPVFVLISNGKQKEIGVRPISNEDYFGYNNGRIIYSVLRQDPRWSYRQYNDLEIKEINSGLKRVITKFKRYVTPDISHNGELVAAISLPTDQSSSLELLNKDGSILFSLKAPPLHIYYYPKFSSEDSGVFYFESNELGEMTLNYLNISKRTSIKLLPFGNRIIGLPVVNGKNLYFTCSSNGRDALWCYNSENGIVHEVSKYTTGIYQGYIHNNSINSRPVIASVFTADGYRLARLSLEPSATSDLKNMHADTLDNQLSGDDTKIKLSPIIGKGKRNFEIAKYSRFTHPFNFHSIQPSIEDPVYSLDLYGENILNTMQTDLYTSYNRVEGSQQFGGSVIYGGWYIQPFLGGSYTINRPYFNPTNNETLLYNNGDIVGGLQLPLNYSGGRHYRYLNFSTSIHKGFMNWKNGGDSLNSDGSLYLDNTIGFSNSNQQTLQQIFPGFAQTISLNYKQSISSQSSWQFLARAAVYFPGLFVNHSFRLSGAYQKQNANGNYTFSYSFPFSRGYDNYLFPQMQKIALDYQLPLLYPSIGLGNIIYFSRIRANLYYDNTFAEMSVKGKKENWTFPSTGLELYCDLNLWNQFPVTIELQYSRLLKKIPTTSLNQWSIILPIKLF